MAVNTDGNAAAEKTATEASAEKTSTAQGADTGGLDKRFAELTGELSRRKAKEERLEKELAVLKAKHQSEDEKRMEELAAAKYGPTLKAFEDLQENLKADRDAMLQQVPEEYAGLVVTDESIPLYKQLKQIQSVIALSKGKGNGAATPGAASPGEKQKARYTKQQFQKWQAMSSNQATLKDYNEQRDEMIAAFREGRIDGM